MGLLDFRPQPAAYEQKHQRRHQRDDLERLQVMLGLKTHAFLEVLARKGTHGTNATDVAKSLIEQGIRDAIKEGFLTAEDVKIIQAKH